MSWQDARTEAQRHLDRLQLKNEDIRGRILDLNELFKDTAFEGRFRTMVLQAAARLLKKRGVNTNIADIVDD